MICVWVCTFQFGKTCYVHTILNKKKKETVNQNIFFLMYTCTPPCDLWSRNTVSENICLNITQYKRRSVGFMWMLLIFSDVDTAVKYMKQTFCTSAAMVRLRKVAVICRSCVISWQQSSISITSSGNMLM